LEAREWIKPQTVLWLDEIHIYLDTPDARVGERLAAGLRELLRDPASRPVLILGTLWPEHWAHIVTVPRGARKDRHFQARALLTGRDIAVPDRFDEIDLRPIDMASDHDPRLVLARDQTDGRITQFLAGAFELRKRYELAPQPERAVINAAMDVRRLGQTTRLPESFLRQAAPGYLDEETWDTLDEDWFARALDYASRPCHGLRGPLTPIRPRPGELVPAEPQYRLADYLEQTAREERRYLAPPAAFWVAAAHPGATPDDLRAFGFAAYRRGRYRPVAELLQRAAKNGDTDALTILALLREEDGAIEEAERFYTQAADEGEVGAMAILASRREAEGDLEAAEGYLTRAIEAGHVDARWQLAQMRLKAGDRTGAERLYTAAADAGNIDALPGRTT
jgi:hypothetical protein